MEVRNGLLMHTKSRWEIVLSNSTSKVRYIVSQAFWACFGGKNVLLIGFL